MNNFTDRIFIESPHDFEEDETVLAVVTVLKCKDCGEYSIGWKRVEGRDDEHTIIS